MQFLYALKEKDLKWILEFCPSGSILWRSEKSGYIPLLGVWGVIECTPLLVLRQFGIKQFIHATDFLKDEAFNYTEENIKEKIKKSG